MRNKSDKVTKILQSRNFFTALIFCVLQFLHTFFILSQSEEKTGDNQLKMWVKLKKNTKIKTKCIAICNTMWYNKVIEKE